MNPPNVEEFLREMSRQTTWNEMEDHEAADADWEGGFEEAVTKAREIVDYLDKRDARIKIEDKNGSFPPRMD